MGDGQKIDADLRERARRFVAKLGINHASVRLRASKDTLEEVCSPTGRLRPVTVARLRDSLDREEQALEREAS
jgi:hypothetical protein